MSWEARKYKDIIDTLTGSTMQLELNLRAVEGYTNILDSKTLNGIIADLKENIEDIKSDIVDLQGTTTATENTIKDFITDINYTLEVE